MNGITFSIAEGVAMILVVLAILGLAIAWLAVPVLRQVGYTSYGRFGRFGDALLVVFVTVIIGFGVGSVLLQSGELSSVIIGTIAALAMVALLTILGGGAASEEERQTKEFSDHR
jgi:uncharacterized membrane protein YwzB